MICFDRKSDSRKGKQAARAFQQWMLSLSWQELTQAARIPLTANDETLLHEMVAAHVPPPTPIHARACPSPSFVSDGRPLAFQKTRRRKHLPRLLQLHHKADALSSSLSNTVPLHRKRKSNRAAATAGHTKFSDPAEYTVKGRNFIQRDGGRLSIPPTRELLEADQTVLDRLALVPVQQSGANHPPVELSSDSGAIQCMICWTSFKSGKLCSKNAVKDTYKLWYLVSRGELGSSDGATTKLRTADWLDPTDSLCRPFSLGMYIISRFEHVLYRRFKSEYDSKLPDLFPRRFSLDTWNSALVGLFKSDIGQASAKVNPRDSMIWKLLDDGLVGRFRRSLIDMRNESTSHGACSLPLLFLDSPTGELWKNLRLAHSESEARRIELELLNDLEDEETVKTSSAKHKPPKNGQSFKRKKKKAKPPKYGNPQGKLSNSDGEISQTSKDSSGSDEVSAETGNLPGGIVQGSAMHSREQNRNLVVVLSIVDEVLDNVFDNIGLGKISEEAEEGLIPVGTKTNEVKMTRFMKGKSMIPVPSSPGVPTKKIDCVSQTGRNQKVTEISRSAVKDPKAAPGELSPSSSGLPGSEIEMSAPPIGADRSSWSVYHGDFISSYPTRVQGIATGLKESLGTDTRPLEGIGETNTYNAFVNSGWYKNVPTNTRLWEPHNYVPLDQWRSLQGNSGRDRSIMEEFFRTQQERELEIDENQMASSTIASIASSTEDVNIRVEDVMDVLEENPSDTDYSDESRDRNQTYAEPKVGIPEIIIEHEKLGEQTCTRFTQESTSGGTCGSASLGSESVSKAPSSGSPILVSLKDIKDLSKEVLVEKDRDMTQNMHGPPSIKSFSSVPTGPGGSLPNSPQEKEKKPKLTSTLSRENIRISLSEDREVPSRTPKRSPSAVSDVARTSQASLGKSDKLKSRDDTEIRPRGNARKAIDALDSYRNAAARSLKSRDDAELRVSQSGGIPNSYKAAAVSQNDPSRLVGPLPFHSAQANGQSDRCAVSEIADDDYPHLNESRRSVPADDGDNITITRDGSTTITSALSQRETEESLREERDTYRDLCLTLGAEVASLKNLLASYRGATSYSSFGHAGQFAQTNGTYQFFDPDSVSNIVKRYSRQQTMAAMSDAGYRGEHESMASEDDIGKEKGSLTQRAQISTGATVADSDVSLEHSVRHETVPVAVPSLRNSYYQAPVGGFQSRLGRDVLQFVNSINLQLQKQDTRRAKAVERMTRLVTAVWPRAQVKVYGSHVTGLCLPSSDVDFVICLPAVHKNAPAVAPGPLEGRNAINETSQKLLARKLKSESWIDPRSMQLIDRTVVPVIKVSTKDTKARSVHLDITFDSPSHHGVDAVGMVLE